MTFSSSIWLVTTGYLAVSLCIGVWASSLGQSSYEHYTIGDKKLRYWHIMFTFFATSFGAGNILGNADKAYKVGLPWLAYIFGAQGSKIVFALCLVGFLARYRYKSLAEFTNEIIVRDRVTRIFSALLLCAPCIAWTGAQAMGVGLLFKYFTGTDPTLVIIITAAVFILYTTIGGMEAVVWTDLFQGVLISFLALFYYYFAFKAINFDFAFLARELKAIDPLLWDLGQINWMKTLNLFLTAAMGTVVLQVFWQRCFAAEKPVEARNGMIFTGVLAMIFVSCTALAGMIVRVMNPELSTGVGAWMMKELLPQWAALLMFVFLIAATMSTADSNLNSAAVCIMNDIILPFCPEMSDKIKIRITMSITVSVGIFAVLGTMYFKYIMDFVNFAYTIAGGTLCPLVIVGLLWKKDTSAPFSHNNSRVTPMASKVSLVAGSVVAILFSTVPEMKALFGGGVIPAGLATTALLFLVSSLGKNRSQVELKESEFKTPWLEE